MAVNINKPQINLREQLKKLERPTTDRLAVKGADGVLIDKLTGELSLQGIDATDSGTAADVFVYDTSKDSDGGAWRKRTQHTSWYNETLNTATRGSRKEFPAVAVIVADNSYHIKIYDGDDPDMPLWMEFQDVGSGSGLIPSPSAKPESVAAINGIIVFGNVAGTVNSGQAGVLKLDFIGDAAYRYMQSSSSSYSGKWIGGGLANRNTGTPTTGSWDNSLGYIVDNDVNDVAMTVLLNAPIDDATGLPVPTIAVATDSGVSIIKDDGTVTTQDYQESSNKISRFVDIQPTGVIRYGNRSYGSTPPGNFYVYSNSDFESRSTRSDRLYTYVGQALSNYEHELVGKSNGYTTPFCNIVGINREEFVVGTGYYPSEGQADNGIYKVIESDGSGDNTPTVANITNTYNTGWMYGDIKGAFLSDTTLESLTANTNLATDAIANGTNRLASETYENGDTSWQMVDNAGNNNGYVKIEFRNLVVGQSYIISMTWDNNAALDSGYNHRISHQDGTGSENHTNFPHWDKTNGSSETLTGVFIAQTTNNDNLIMYANAITLNVSNFIVRAVDDEDRSINNKGLQVYGTVTKSAVATGSELVAYSGFSASNYLQQPYNSDLDFGSGDFNVTFWYKAANGSTQCILHRGDGDSGGWGSGPIIQIEFNGTNLAAFLAESSFSSYDTIGIPVATSANNEWTQYVLTRSSGMMNVYLNGSLYASTPSTRSLSNVEAKTWIGERPYQTRAADNTSLALFRIGSTAPSAEQIKKMYEDEKHLFQENAKATLYGSSDAVTALAYDTTTKSLHAGTSSGRSEFKGLRRVSNTTIAVTTAISASNGLVAEQ